MAMGSYFLGSTVRIPLHISENGMAFTEDVSPKIKTIVKPNGKSAFSSAQNMSTLSSDYATYYFDYKPDTIGDYVVIINYYLDDDEFTVIENFTVNSKTSMVAAPRAESR